MMLTLNNGKKMPVMGVGTYNGFGQNKPDTTLAEAVQMALEIGYRHIDCAHAHNNEVEIGVAIQYGRDVLKIRRLSSKCCTYANFRYIEICFFLLL